MADEVDREKGPDHPPRPKTASARRISTPNSKGGDRRRAATHTQLSVWRKLDAEHDPEGTANNEREPDQEA
jgi:hypothetical protein